jgi:hypothetical protein
MLFALPIGLFGCQVLGILAGEQDHSCPRRSTSALALLSPIPEITRLLRWPMISIIVKEGA